MDILNNIAAMHKPGSVSPHKTQANNARAKEIFGFLKLLSGENGKAKGNEGIAAKLSRLVEENPTKAAELQKILTDTKPGTKDEAIKQIRELLDERDSLKPALSTDLALLLQGATDEDTLMTALEEQFAALSDLSPEAMEDFRQDAIDYMKGLGLNDADIEGYLVKFSMAHGEQLSQAQATQFMMPLPPTPTSTTLAAHDAPEQTPQMLAEQQLQTATQNAGSDDAPDIGHTPKQTSSSQTSATSNLALINGFSGSEGGFGADGFGGQNFSQPNSNGFGGTLSCMTPASAATPESFVNHMAASSQSQTTQMIALQIQRNAQAQINTFKMQLHPSELGRLDVRLRFMRDGTMKAHITTDKADTLSLLQKDSSQLHRILEQAGLAMDENALSFDLRQQQDSTHQSYNDNPTPASENADGDIAMDNALQAKIAVEAMGTIRQGGVNIMV